MTQATPEKLQMIIEAAIMVSDHPMTIAQLLNLFPDDARPDNAEIKAAIAEIRERYQASGLELQEVASGYRFQTKAELSPWLARLWEERAPRYSRAFLETLAIIAYKQPITRAEIEDIRGVTVNSHIIKTLLDREWIRVIGFRDLPGKPAILGTTKKFLDNFNLKTLADMPSLAEIKSLEAQEAQLQVQLALQESDIGPSNSEAIPEEREAILSEDEQVAEENNVVQLNRDDESEQDHEEEHVEDSEEDNEEEQVTG